MNDYLRSNPPRFLGADEGLSLLVRGGGGLAGAGVCSAWWQGAELGARSWAKRWGLVGDAAQARRLAGMGHGRMAGFVAPAGSSAELEVLACWGAFITLVDDGFDQGGEHASVSEVRAVLDPLVEVLKGTTGARAGCDAPAVAALEDLWRRTVVGTAPGWCARFAASYASFAKATCEEARWRQESYTPSVAEYIAVRRRTITVAPLLLVSERLLDAWPQAEVLHDVCSDAVAWTNDVFDAGTEHAGEIGLVGVLARERGVGRGEAAAMARAMIEERLDDFESAAERLAVLNPHDGGVRSRIERVRTFLYGAVAWQYESRRYRATLPVQHAPRNRAADPIESAAVRLERRLALAVAPGGALPDRCAGRVLETALLLALLRARDTYPKEERELACWLEERRAGADALDGMLIDAVLRPQTLPADAAAAAAPFVGDAVSSAGRRGRLKRSMLHAVLHVLGGLRLNPAEIPPAAGGTVSTFTLANLLAVRVIYAQATDRPHAVSTGERFQLADVLEKGSGRLLWEASAATHLLALNALQSCRPGHPVVAPAVTGLLLARDSDGAMPFLDSQDVWLSAVGGLAFLARRSLRPYTARMGAFVAAWQAPDGGWPFAAGIRQTDVDTAARCMEFLHALDPHRYRTHLARGAAYLAAKAGPDGGFPTWREGDDPDLDMTAGAVLALTPHGRTHAPLVTAATHYILDTQHGDGTWQRSWTLSESSVILRAVDALHAARDTLGVDSVRAAAAITRAVARLTATQQPDGGWGHTPDHDTDPLSTAQAIPVLARYGPPHATAAATACLLSCQDDTGRFPAPPDQTGPRPLAFDYPVVADLHALTALTRPQADVLDRFQGMPARMRR
ncbi:hypothetical protein OG322_40570 [Streptomyces sp. NBC_01260]|uniref:terpene synthase family protein n=1 Tax=unclassified Streptomyces TaxID=2593676 RepID=UPI0011CD3B5F|nr:MULTISPECIES: prenyltransferase/squalene oxidase repeat-containing protein [unclassified Streptomyces]MCX4774977.1 hypothetical protein [Streptomyces sp. NBC_01285]